MKRNKILLAEANRLFADALRKVIEGETDFNVVCSAHACADALRSVRELCPDVLVAGELFSDMGMIQTARELRRNIRDIRFLFIVKQASSELLSLLGEIENAGAVSESSDTGEFLSALRSVSNGERYVSTLVLDSRSREPKEQCRCKDPLAGITQREREVLYWLSHGFTNKEIADIMILSEKTIKNHVSHILKKLDISDRTKAAALAWQEGLSFIPEEFFSLSYSI